MNTTNIQRTYTAGLLNRFHLRRGLAFGLIIISALLAFEIFNYSTTEFALGDLLGELDFLGVSWATILAVAFCGIDFAGIARLFTPEEGADEPGEVWYLFGAWLLAATMNAMLTWWGISIALLSHDTLGNVVIDRQMLLRVVPIFVAVMVWLIRVLIIGSFSVAGERLFSQADKRTIARPRTQPRIALESQPVRSLGTGRAVSPRAASPANSSFRPAPKTPVQQDSIFNRPEPTYHPVGMNAASNEKAGVEPATRTPFSRPRSDYGNNGNTRMFSDRGSKSPPAELPSRERRS